MEFNHVEKMKPVCIHSAEGVDIFLEIHDNHPFVHFENFNPSIKTFKEILKRLKDFKHFLGCIGYPYVFGAVPKENKKIIRLYKKLGLKVIAENSRAIIVVLETGDNNGT